LLAQDPAAQSDVPLQAAPWTFLVPQLVALAHAVELGQALLAGTQVCVVLAQALDVTV
jgi:hypothetical protein